MKGFVCGVCGFVAIDGSAPEKCPVCGAPKTAFTEKAEAVKTAGAAAVGEPEKKHLPAISVARKCALIPDGCIDVHVTVGEILHPMLAEHHIRWIDCYIDRKYVARVHLTPGMLHPAACLHLKAPGGRFTAIENCNLHGTWMSEAEL